MTPTARYYATATLAQAAVLSAWAYIWHLVDLPPQTAAAYLAILATVGALGIEFGRGNPSS